MPSVKKVNCRSPLPIPHSHFMFRTMVLKSNGRSVDRRARRALATREAILRAAAGVFRDRGFAETGMREIAAAADLSPGNLYYYFKSKADILYFCQNHSVDRMLAAVKDLGPDQGAAERLRQIVIAHLLCTLDELEGAAAHTEVEALPADLRKKIVAKRDRYERAVRSIVSDGIKSGAFVGADPVLATRAILGALNWTTRWYRPGGKLPPQAVADAFADYLVRGLAA
jgi:AcrR family transcriptional regulator